MDEEMGVESQESISETVQTAKDVSGKAKNTAKSVARGAKKIGRAAIKVGKAIGKAIVKTASAIFKFLLGNPIVLIILIIVLVLVVAIVAIIYIFTGLNFDAEKGMLASVFGISGDKFYGARFIYQDDEAANLEIQEDYLTFTYNILNDTKNEIGLNISLSAVYTTDEKIVEIATDFANDLVNNQDEELTLEQCVKKIDHFGFSDNEITIVIDSIASTLKNNSSNNSWATSNISKIKSALTSKSQTENYVGYSNVTPKIYVWDYILEDNDSTLEQLPKKDYIGFVFMPKENVVMTSASFFFIIENGLGVDVCLYKQEGQNAIPYSEPQNANVTWFNEDGIQELYKCDINETLQPFTAINASDLNALATPTSIFTLLKNGTYLNYFNETENYDGVTLIQNICDSKYIYLYMDNIDENRLPFNFAESIVDYV